MFYWRSHDGLEVDLIIQAGLQLIPVEIKLTATPTEKHVQALDKFKKVAEEDAGDQGILVCRVDKQKALPGGNMALPWNLFSSWLNKELERTSTL